MLLCKVCNTRLIIEEPTAPNKLMSEQQFWAAENKPGDGGFECKVQQCHIILLYIYYIIKVAYRSEPVTVIKALFSLGARARSHVLANIIKL